MNESQVPALLAAVRRGESRAVEELFSLLYPGLRQLAHARLRRSGRFTLLETTALVHESFLRLFKAGTLEAGDKGQFMGYAARVMRSVVIDYVRRRAADRRGGDVERVELDDDTQAIASRCPGSARRWWPIYVSFEWSGCPVGGAQPSTGFAGVASMR